MEILFFCPHWGQETISWELFAEKVKQAGYDGIEAGIPDDENEKKCMLDAIARNNLLFIGQHWETVIKDHKKHKVEYEQRIRNLASAKPLFINSQTGKDYYSFQENYELIEIAENIAGETGVSVFHETHRGKFSFASHVTKDYLERIPDLKLTLDISHWCAVAESLLHDQPEAVELAIQHTEHIHARVGNTQQAQVNDPRDPGWNEAIGFHLKCWDKVFELKASSGYKQITVTCEFGPFPYMIHLPFTKHPVSDQWEINNYMKDMIKNRYK